MGQVLTWLDARLDIRGLAHITGGGLVDNPVRILPEGVDYVLHRNAWTVPPIFNFIRHQGSVTDAEMARVFNLGLGMLVFLPQQQVEEAQRLVPEAGPVGHMQLGKKSVVFQA